MNVCEHRLKVINFLYSSSLRVGKFHIFLFFKLSLNVITFALQLVKSTYNVGIWKREWRKLVESRTSPLIRLVLSLLPSFLCCLIFTVRDWERSWMSQNNYLLSIYILAWNSTYTRYLWNTKFSVNTFWVSLNICFISQGATSITHFRYMGFSFESKTFLYILD